MKIKTRQEQINDIKHLSDQDIDYSDAPAVTDFINWEPNPFFKPVKVPLSARIDKDIFAWLKMHGEVSQYLNKLLRKQMFEERYLAGKAS